MPTPAACLLEVGAGLEAQLEPGDLILLGRYRQHFVFAAEFQGDEAPQIATEGEFLDLRLAGGSMEPNEAGLLAYARAMVTWL